MVSRLARNPIDIPDGVDVNIAGRTITVKGKLGELHQEIHHLVRISQKEACIRLEPAGGDKRVNAMLGTMTALVKNMIQGVSEGYECQMVLVGVGYRAKTQGNQLSLTLGLSHPVDMEMPKGVTVETPSQTEISLKGADKQQVFQVAANIRAKRPPEPYKGKGIRYRDEQIVRKEAKKK